MVGSANVYFPSASVVVSNRCSTFASAVGLARRIFQMVIFAPSIGFPMNESRTKPMHVRASAFLSPAGVDFDDDCGSGDLAISAVCAAGLADDCASAEVNRMVEARAGD